jgi:hypothetical protein
MADSLQKIDRLIEGQSQLTEIATRADQKADTTAKGVARLTVSTQRQYEDLKGQCEDLKAGRKLLCSIYGRNYPNDNN